jgi:DNA (cytosine-5)-methyltransferase 1
MKRRDKKFHTLREVAQQVGVAPITLRRWLLSGRVGEVSRDRNGWRLFTERDVRRIRAFAVKTQHPHK